MNWRSKLLIISLFLLLSGLRPGTCGEVIIKGFQPGWSGREISFYTFSNPVVEVKELLGKVRVDENGYFATRFSLDRPVKILADEGIYRMYFYAGPGTSCELRLPPYREKSKEEWLNPFFQPAEIHLAFEGDDSTSLNAGIRHFDHFFNPVYHELAVQVYGRRKVDGLDRAVEMLKTRFPADSGYFLRYRDHKLTALHFLARQHESKKPADQPFPDAPPEWNNPAYRELFAMAFQGIFNRMGSDPEWKSLLSNAYRSGKPGLLTTMMAGRLQLSYLPLVEMVLVKGLFDAANNEDIPFSLAAVMLDSLAAQSVDSSVRQFAAQTARELVRLKPGYEPPPLLPGEVDGSASCLLPGTGRYVYLVFGSMDSYTFLRELPLLSEIATSRAGTIRVVLVLAGTTPDPDKKEELEAQGIQISSVGFGSKVLESYRVKSFPSYFLLGPDGRFLWSPAPSPTEQFYEKFTRLLEQDQ